MEEKLLKKAKELAKKYGLKFEDFYDEDRNLTDGCMCRYNPLVGGPYMAFPTEDGKFAIIQVSLNENLEPDDFFFYDIVEE